MAYCLYLGIRSLCDSGFEITRQRKCSILLQGTTTADKNELLWKHNINYQSLPEQMKKVCGMKSCFSWMLHAVQSLRAAFS